MGIKFDKKNPKRMKFEENKLRNYSKQNK